VLSASNPSSTAQAELAVGTLQFGVVGSGVALITGTIQSMLIRTQDYSSVYEEVQDAAFVSGTGYVSLALASRRRSLHHSHLPRSPPSLLAAAAGQLRAGRRLSTSCDPCASLVWGDLNGDCKYLSSDVDYLARLIADRLDFEGGNTAIDPLDNPSAWTVNNVSSCSAFFQLQANPSRDLIAVSDSSDPRYLKPAVTAVDAQVKPEGRDRPAVLPPPSRQQVPPAAAPDLVSED
jgi:hypothetical protein